MLGERGQLGIGPALLPRELAMRSETIWRAVDLRNAASDQLLEEPADLARPHHRIQMCGQCLSDLGTKSGYPKEIRDATALAHKLVEHRPRLVRHVRLNVDHG